MTTPIILPEDAERAGCEAVVLQTGTGYSGEVSYYRLVAKAAPGWEFIGWKWTEVVRYHPKSTIPDGYSIPQDRDLFRSTDHDEYDVEEYLGLYSSTSPGRQYTMDKTIVGLKAEFIERGTGAPMFDRGTGLILHGASGAILCDL